MAVIDTFDSEINNVTSVTVGTNRWWRTYIITVGASDITRHSAGTAGSDSCWLRCNFNVVDAGGGS